MVASDGKTRPEAAAAARAAEALFGQRVIRITGPGGKSRSSLRVHFPDMSVIASWRGHADVQTRETTLLERLHAAGAPVPKSLGTAEGWTFQSDAGSRRLSSALERCEGAAREALAARAFGALRAVSDAADRAGLTRQAPAIALGRGWLDRFAAGPAALAERVGREAPVLDSDALVNGIACPPDRFVKWDARAGNAAVGADGAVTWFDWEDYGRRGGVEDAAFLAADEFWPLGADLSIDIMRDAGLLPDRLLPLFTRFACLQSIARARLILREVDRHGWGDADRARRYDRIGTTPDLLARCLDTASRFADRDRLTAALSPWLAALSTSAGQDAL